MREMRVDSFTAGIHAEWLGPVRFGLRLTLAQHNIGLPGNYPAATPHGGEGWEWNGVCRCTIRWT